MAITYTELVQLVQDYLENDEATFVANIPQFVELAEQRINQAITLPIMQLSATATMAIGNPYLGLPADCQNVRGVTITVSGASVPLLQKDQSYIREVFTSGTGQPRVYAIFDEEAIQIGPTPDQNYSTTLDYIADPESIVTAETTWVGDNCQMLLVYATLAEAYRYMQGEPDMQNVYDGQFNEALQAWGSYARKMPATDEERNGLSR
jgi:hypothetical protein